MEIPVNEDQWNALSSDEQQKIIAAFKEVELIRKDDTIVADSTAVVEDEDADDATLKGWNPKKELCKNFCNAAAATAAAWCTANTSGLGLAACLAAAEVARKKCRKRC